MAQLARYFLPPQKLTSSDEEGQPRRASSASRALSNGANRLVTSDESASLPTSFLDCLELSELHVHLPREDMNAPLTPSHACFVLKCQEDELSSLSVFRLKQLLFLCLEATKALVDEGVCSQTPKIIRQSLPRPAEHGQWTRVLLPTVAELRNWRGNFRTTQFQKLVSLQQAQDQSSPSFIDITAEGLKKLDDVLSKGTDYFVFQCLKIRPEDPSLSLTSLQRVDAVTPLCTDTFSPECHPLIDLATAHMDPSTSSRYTWLDNELMMAGPTLIEHSPALKESLLPLIAVHEDLSRPEPSLHAVASIELSPAHRVPPPPIEVRITRTKRTMDAQSQSYTQYEIEVSHGTLQWSILRRYSEFAALHQKVTEQAAEQGLTGGKIDLASLSPLPRKKFVGSLKDETVENRKDALDLYIRKLVSQDGALANVHVLAFLGLLSMSRTEALPGATPSQEKQRPVMHISRVRDSLQSGDILLFRSNNSMSGLQRAATGAEWDHVALVVRSPYGRTFDLLESTAEGVTAYPLISRIRAYSHGFCKYMAIRKLEGNIDPNMTSVLSEFTLKVDGKPYGFSFSKLFPRKEAKAVTDSPAEAAEVEDLLKPTSPFVPDADRKKTFFCSELVAAAMKHAGIVPQSYSCSYFWPGSFAVGGEVDEAVVEGYSYGPEIILDCRIVEVGHAQRVTRSSV